MAVCIKCAGIVRKTARRNGYALLRRLEKARKRLDVLCCEVTDNFSLITKDLNCFAVITVCVK